MCVATNHGDLGGRAFEWQHPTVGQQHYPAARYLERECGMTLLVECFLLMSFLLLGFLLRRMIDDAYGKH
jgi:hypothetical protein